MPVQPDIVCVYMIRIAHIVLTYVYVYMICICVCAWLLLAVSFWLNFLTA